MDRLGSASPLLGPRRGSRFNDGVHVLHQLQLLPPEVLLLDELLPGLVLLLPDPLLFGFQSEEMHGWMEGELAIRYFEMLNSPYKRQLADRLVNIVLHCY